MKAQDQLIAGNLAGTAFQYLLPAPADGQQAALAGAFCFEVILFKLSAELPGQKVLQGNAHTVLFIKCCRKPGAGKRQFNMKTGRGCEGIPLYMIDTKAECRILPLACQTFISRIALMVDGAQQGAQFF